MPAAPAPIPAGYERLVDSARQSLMSNIDGLVRPSLAFTDIRCFANGGLVVLFRQIGGLSPGQPAFAMGGQQAVAPDAYAWSGGYGDMDEIEEEVDFNFRDVPEIACPPRAT